MPSIKAIKKLNLRPYFSGLLPLFILAHFGHHVIGAIIRPLMPMVRTDLGLSYTQAGMVMSSFAITSGISQLPAGWLSDRFGARVMVLLSVTGVALTGFLIGFSNSFVTLTMFIVISAIMGGGYHPAASATISSSIAPEYRGRALGLHFIGGSSTMWIVPLWAAAIAAAWGWRNSFIILAIPTSILGILLFILIGRRSQAQISQSQDINIDNKPTTTPIRINWRQMAPFIIVSVATGTMIQSPSSYISLYAVDELGTTEAAAAMMMSIIPAVGPVAGLLGGYLSDRFGSIPVILILSLLSIPLIYLMGLVGNVATLIALLVVIGLVSSMRMPTSESFIAGNTPAHRRATILGLYFFANTEVAGLLTPVMGYLIDRFNFYYTFTTVSIVIGMIIVIASIFLWRNRK